MKGFPALIRWPDPVTVEMTLLDAEPVPEEKETGALDATYFARLEKMLDAMHARGINHGDLRRKNLLRAPGDPSTPLMVDFTQCLHFRTPVRGIRGMIFRQAIRIDRVTLLKLKRWFLGDAALTEKEREEAANRPWHLKLGRFVRKKIYRPFKHWSQGRRGFAKKKR